MALIKRIVNRLRGNYKVALDQGLHVGKEVSIMNGVNFGSEPYLITLEDYCRISSDVIFITHDGGTWAFRDIPKYSKIIKYGKINVGSHTFIGARSIIMPGVRIGSRCVVGAGSIVTKDVPDGSVVVGAPARIIMRTDEYAEKCLLSLKPYNEEEYSSNKREYLQKYLSD